MPTYSYNPDNITNRSVDRMRFQLGDTVFEPGELTAALSDEEYREVIHEYPNWKKAKIECLRAILMKYSHQVSTRIDGVSYNFNERVETYKAMLDKLEKNSSSAPGNTGAGFENPTARPYFYEDMHSNNLKG